MLLVTMNLAQTLETLPAEFVRVHKSHAVNRRHVASVAPRPGGGKLLRMTGGGSVPVGRAYAAVLTELNGDDLARGRRTGGPVRPSPSDG